MVLSLRPANLLQKRSHSWYQAKSATALICLANGRLRLALVAKNMHGCGTMYTVILLITLLFLWWSLCRKQHKQHLLNPRVCKFLRSPGSILVRGQLTMLQHLNKQSLQKRQSKHRLRSSLVCTRMWLHCRLKLVLFGTHQHQTCQLEL